MIEQEPRSGLTSADEQLIEHNRTRSWTGRAEVERETSWVDWYNTTHIHHSIGKMSAIEFEERYRLASLDNTDKVA